MPVIFIDRLYCYKATVFIISIWLAFFYFVTYHNSDWLAIFHFTLSFFWRFKASRQVYQKNQKRRRSKRWPAKKNQNQRYFLKRRQSKFPCIAKINFHYQLKRRNNQECPYWMIFIGATSVPLWTREDIMDINFEQGEWIPNGLDVRTMAKSWRMVDLRHHHRLLVKFSLNFEFRLAWKSVWV